MGLVAGTGWNEFLELNRLAFSDVLPRNSESRALAVAMRLLRKYAPHVQWVISFADGTQSGDGAIYRAVGFVLTSIKKNNQIWAAQTDARESRISLTDGRSREQQSQAVCLSRVTATKAKNILESGAASMKSFAEAGFRPLPGYQLRYIYFIDPLARERLTVPVLPFSEIARVGAGMYLGKPTSPTSIVSDASGVQPEEGGATPTVGLQ